MSILDKTKSMLSAATTQPNVKKAIYADNEARGSEAVRMAERLRDEAMSYRKHLEAEWNEAGHQYLGNQWGAMRSGVAYQDMQEGTRTFQTFDAGEDGDDDLVKVVLNRTQNSILSNAEAQIATPPAIAIEPEESGEPAEYWLSKGGARILMQMRMSMEAELGQLSTGMMGQDPSFTDPNEAAATAEQIAAIEQQLEAIPDIGDRFDEQYGMAEPLTESEVGQVRDMIDAEMMKEEDLKTVNDTTTAKCAKRVLDRLARTARLEAIYQRDVIKRTAYGQACISLQYHTDGPKRYQFSLCSEHPLSVWLDPGHETMEEADFAGLDRELSLERAKAEYQDVPAEVWESAVQMGSEEDARGVVTSHTADEGRDMVYLSILWVRNHDVPAPVADAVEWGWVNEESVTEDVPIGDEVLEEDGLPVEVRQVPVVDEKTSQIKKRYTLTAEGAAMVKGGEGEEVEPQEDIEYIGKWPRSIGLRKVVWVHGLHEPIMDVRCPYHDIELAWAVNVPRIDGSPYGQGDAKRLEGLQREINRVLSIIINNARYAQAPMIYMPLSLFQLLEQQGLTPYMTAGGYWPVPDSTYNSVMLNGGFSGGSSQPPELNNGMFNLLDKLLEEHDNLAGNVGVRQGRAPYAGASGEAIAQLKEEAMGTLTLKARHGEYQLQKLGELMLDAIVKWHPETEWQKVCSEWELPALRSLIARCEKLKMNVKVAISSGRGAQKEIDKQNALGLYDRNLLPAEDTLRLIEIDDVEGVLKRRTSEAQQINPQPAPAPAPAQAPQ